jgi:hypothetical protein
MGTPNMLLSLALLATVTARLPRIPCPCSPASLCAPLTARPPHEVWGFAPGYGPKWQQLDWSALTTIAMPGGDDAHYAHPQLLCEAHARGVRILVAVDEPFETLAQLAALGSNATRREQWVGARAADWSTLTRCGGIPGSRRTPLGTPSWRTILLR